MTFGIRTIRRRSRVSGKMRVVSSSNGRIILLLSCSLVHIDNCESSNRRIKCDYFSVTLSVRKDIYNEEDDLRRGIVQDSSNLRMTLVEDYLKYSQVIR